MLNRYPLWKYLLLLVSVIISLIYAIPNYYIPDPALQVSGQSGSVAIDAAVLQKVEASLKEAQIDYFDPEVNGKTALVRLHSVEKQMIARKRVQQSLGDEYVVALNAAPTTPQWLRSIGASPMKLGLDLAGGVHFLLEVDTASAIEKRQLITADDFKEKLRKAKIRYTSIGNNNDNTIVAHFRSAEIRAAFSGVFCARAVDTAVAIKASAASALRASIRRITASPTKVESRAVARFYPVSARWQALERRA